METVVTIISKWYLGWEQVQNAILFVASGSGATVSYLVVTIIAQKRIFDDRQVLVYGVTMATLMMLSIGTIASVASYQIPWLMPVLIIQIFFFVSSLPPIIASAATIIAKNTPKKDQAFIQSIRTVAERSAQILFPNWYSTWIWTASTLVSNYHVLGRSLGHET